MTTPDVNAPGKRLFVAGSIVLVVFSTVHMIPMFADMFIEPTVPVEIEAKRAMAAVGVKIGPFHTHWGKLNQLLSVSYSTLLFFVAALNFVALPAIVAIGRLRAIALVNVVFVSILLVISIFYNFPPPAVFALVADALFVVAAIRSVRR